jgi:endogenous inhibitor of DNA gyrase (YacG/DUF329 family)
MNKEVKPEIVGEKCPECGIPMKKEEVKAQPGFGIVGTRKRLKCPNCGYIDRDHFRNISFFH